LVFLDSFKNKHKYKVFGRKAEEISKKFYWSEIIKKYLEIL